MSASQNCEGGGTLSQVKATICTELGWALDSESTGGSAGPATVSATKKMKTAMINYLEKNQFVPGLKVTQQGST